MTHLCNIKFYSIILFVLYSVNAIAFAPQNTFLTAGSDGVIAYWDKNSRYRLKLLDAYQRTSSITAAILSPRVLFYFIIIVYLFLLF